MPGTSVPRSQPQRNPKHRRLAQVAGVLITALAITATALPAHADRGLPQRPRTTTAVAAPAQPTPAPTATPAYQHCTGGYTLPLRCTRQYTPGDPPRSDPGTRIVRDPYRGTRG